MNDRERAEYPQYPRAFQDGPRNASVPSAARQLSVRPNKMSERRTDAAGWEDLLRVQRLRAPGRIETIRHHHEITTLGNRSDRNPSSLTAAGYDQVLCFLIRG